MTAFMRRGTERVSADSEKWQELQELFHLASETAEHERDRVLLAACADERLRRRALKLAAAGNGESPPGEAHSTEPAAQKTVGPYTLVQLLGAGGMGAVYLAERKAGGATQRLALKLLAPHAAGPSFVERFEREQRILASLEHPGITRMLDAGWGADGRPYLAMEYVEGAPIDRYCDDRSLDIPARLRLFAQVCDAVDYAHRNLVVHLDLKPSNILAGADGFIKLLDFGAAKLMQPDGQFTATVMATPSYASPEQLRGNPPTTACDIYSLGVVLFELLSGRRPSGSTPAQAFQRAITGQEPERAETAITQEAAERRGATTARLRWMLAGDLSSIVAKCLRPRPQDRYASVSALGDDIARYLSGRPVLAQKQTARYQLKMFVRRNRVSVVAACVVFLAMSAATVIALRAAQSERLAADQARLAAQAASRESDRSQRVTHFLEDVLTAANPTARSSGLEGGANLKLVDVMAAASNHLSTVFADDPGVQSQLHGEIGRAYMGMGKIDAARAEVKAALDRVSALDDNPGEKARVLHMAARLDYETGQPQQAEAKERKAIELVSRMPTVVDMASRSIMANNLALFLRAQGKPDESQEALLQALHQAETAPHPPLPETTLLRHNVGVLALDRGDLARAREQIPLAVSTYESMPSPPVFLAAAEGNLAIVEAIDGHFESALRDAEKAAADAMRIAGADHPVTVRSTILLSYFRSHLNPRAPLDPGLASLVERERQPGFRPNLAEGLEFLGSARALTGHAREGEPPLREALALRQAQPKSVYRLAAAQAMLADCLDRQGRSSEARLLYASAAALLEKSLGPGVYATEQARSKAAASVPNASKR